MVGREIRATVVKAGGEGGLIQLRSGGRMIEARATGAALKAGQQLFLKVEQQGQGRYRLVVLEPGGSAGQSQGAFIASTLSQSLPPGPLHHLFGGFLRFYNAKRARGSAASISGGVTGAGSSSEKMGTAGASRASSPDNSAKLVSRMLESVATMSGRIQDLDQGALAGFLQNLATPGATEQPPDFWFSQGWGEASNDDGEDIDEPVEDYVAALGRLAEPPFYFLTEFKLATTGRISILVLAPDPEFRRVSLFLHPERLEIANWLEESRHQMKQLIGGEIEWERLEIVRPVAESAETGGGLLDLQG